MKINYPFKLSCKESAALMLAREDRSLSLTDRTALRLHLAICKACPHFESQVLTMRSAMQQWRSQSDGER